METFWSVRANKVMEIVPMEATEKGVERGREREKEGEPKTDSHNVVCQPACLPAQDCFCLSWRDTHSAERKKKSAGTRISLEMRRKNG